MCADMCRYYVRRPIYVRNNTSLFRIYVSHNVIVKLCVYIYINR